jgi:hypothetical protein
MFRRLALGQGELAPARTALRALPARLPPLQLLRTAPPALSARLLHPQQLFPQFRHPRRHREVRHQ